MLASGRLIAGCLCAFAAGISFLLLLGLAISQLLGEIKLQQLPMKATGKIVGIEKEVLRPTKTPEFVYCPVVQYTQANRQVSYFKSSIRSKAPAYSPGQIVTVYYLPGSRINSEKTHEIVSAYSVWWPWLNSAIATLLFLPCTLGAYACLRKVRLRDTIKGLGIEVRELFKN